MPTEKSAKFVDVMKYESTLPEGFNGVFYFTNSWPDRDFVGVWGGKEYIFPANSTSPMIIPEHSPIEIQNIRKKFAKDWAEQDFFKSQGYENLRSPEGTRDEKSNTMIDPRVGLASRANSYSLDMLTSRIQSCLQPLQVAQATVRPTPRVELREKLRRNDKDGTIVTGAMGLGDDKSLEQLAKGTLEERVLGK